MSWIHGKHAFKWGGEYRSEYSNGYATPTAPIPQAQGGAGNNPTAAFQNITNFPAMVLTNQTTASQLLYFLSGSVNVAQQVYFLQNSKDITKWANYLSGHKIIDVRQNAFAAFFKDDWKMTPRLTWNLGVRYEYFGVPFENNGLGMAPVDGGIALLGVTGRTFDRWLRPGDGGDLNLLTTPEFVGPHTVNPQKSLYRNDWNNWGPAVGFAWDLPWFGAGKTNVRGGYQMTFSGGGRLVIIDNNVFSNPGFQNIPTTNGPSDGSLFDLRNLPNFVPVPPSRLPVQPILPIKENQNGAAFDYNLATPYVQNFTLSVTRQLSPRVDLDVRYIGNPWAEIGRELQSERSQRVQQPRADGCVGSHTPRRRRGTVRSDVPWIESEPRCCKLRSCERYDAAWLGAPASEHYVPDGPGERRLQHTGYAAQLLQRHGHLDCGVVLGIRRRTRKSPEARQQGIQRAGRHGGGRRTRCAGRPVPGKLDFGQSAVQSGELLLGFGKFRVPLTAGSVTTFCTLLAVQDSSGKIVLQNPQPGSRGNIGRQTIENPGTWDFDANVRKTFQFGETKSLQIRIDATNILNHPLPSNPSFNLNATNAFGYIADKTDAHRQFQAQLRFGF